MKFKNIKKKISKKKSPSNFRIIPAFAKTSTSANASADKSAGKAEHFKFPFPKINNIALLRIYHSTLKVFVIAIFIAAVIIVGFDFQNNLQTKQNIDFKRETLTKDLNFWEDFISKHQNYPDAYFQTSILEYKLGDISRAKTYAEKGSVLDPNSENGRKIEQLLR